MQIVPTVKMVRARRVESDRSEWLALTAVMTAISAVHRKVARALFRFRNFIATGQHDLPGIPAQRVPLLGSVPDCTDLLAIVKMPAAFGPTRPRSCATSRGRPIRTYVGTVLPAWQPQKTNWCHGLTAESENCRPVGQHHCAAENGRSVKFSPSGHHSMTQTAPGKLGTGPGGPAGPPLPTAGRSTDGPDGARTESPGQERG